MEENSKIPELSTEEMEELVSEINDLEEMVENPSKEFNHNLIINMLSEFLDTFTIFGYSSEGDEVVLNCTKSHRDSRALQGLIEDYVQGRLGSKIMDEDYYDDDDDD